MFERYPESRILPDGKRFRHSTRHFATHDEHDFTLWERINPREERLYGYTTTTIEKGVDAWGMVGSRYTLPDAEIQRRGYSPFADKGEPEKAYRAIHELVPELRHLGHVEQNGYCRVELEVAARDTGPHRHIVEYLHGREERYERYRLSGPIESSVAILPELRDLSTYWPVNITREGRTWIEGNIAIQHLDYRAEMIDCHGGKTCRNTGDYMEEVDKNLDPVDDFGGEDD